MRGLQKRRWQASCSILLTDIDCCLSSGHCRAREWVAETVEWLATEVLAGQLLNCYNCVLTLSLGCLYGHCRAREWVAETLEWLATEVLAGQDRHTGGQPWSSNPYGSSGMGGAGAADRRSISAFLGAATQATPQDRERLRADFVDTVS